MRLFFATFAAFGELRANAFTARRQKDFSRKGRYGILIQVLKGTAFRPSARLPRTYRKTRNNIARSSVVYFADLRMQASTESLCTSSPAQQAIRASTVSSRGFLSGDIASATSLPYVLPCDALQFRVRGDVQIRLWCGLYCRLHRDTVFADTGRLAHFHVFCVGFQPMCDCVNWNSGRPNAERGLAQNLVLSALAERKSAEFV